MRKILRKFGLNKLIVKLISGNKYEKKFHKAMLEKIQNDFIVYDVGANIGYYTNIFSEYVPDGMVIAFEPSKQNFTKLLENTKYLKNCQSYNIALGSTNGFVEYSQGSDEIGATTQVSLIKESFNLENQVPIYTLDTFFENNSLPSPNAIKIDVEGFELEVVSGMKNLLSRNEIKYVFIEVHFELLNKKGYLSIKQEIRNLFDSNKFEIKWVDFSHIIVCRKFD